MAVTFIQKKHWEFVQGESNALKLSPHKYLIPSVSDEKYKFQISIDKKLSLFVLLLDDFRFGMITLLNFLRMRMNKIYTHFYRG